jgi:hypothetical protein
MRFGLQMLVALVAVAACSTEPAPEETGEATPVVAERADIGIFNMNPMADSDTFFFLDMPWVEFTSRPNNVSLELDGFTGDVVEEAGRYTLVLDEALEPSTTYSLTVEWSPSSYSPLVVSFSTSAFGEPIVDSSALVGGTWILDFDSGTFVEPAGLGAILQSQFAEQVLLVGATPASEPDQGTVMLQAAIGQSTLPGWEQDPCETSSVWTAGPDGIEGTADDTPATFDDPMLSFGPQDVVVPLAGLETLFGDLELNGILHPEGTEFAGVSFSATIDTRSLDESLDPEGGVGAMCELLEETIGVSCIECGGDEPGPYCLPFSAIDMELPRVDGLTLEALACEDIIGRVEAGTCTANDAEEWDPTGDGSYEGCPAWSR